MAEIGVTPDVTMSGLLQKFRDLNNAPTATADDMFANVMGAKTSFVASGAAMTLEALHNNFAPSAPLSGLYARVSNLYNGVSMSAAGGLDEIMRCRFDVTNNVYRWMPQRPDYNRETAATGGTVTLLPLVTPPTLRLTGTLLGNLTVTPSSANAYVGEKFNVVQGSVLGLFTTTLTGLIGSNITLLGNSVQLLEFTPNGWSKASV